MSERGGLSRFLPTGAGWVFLLAFLYLQLKLPAQDDPDVWWHLKVGELILAQREIPRADAFSFTVPGIPWTAHEWLSEVLMHLLDRAGGFPLLILARSLGVAAGVALGFAHAARHVPARSAFLAALAMFAASHAVWAARPQVISFVFTAITFTLLERWRRARGGAGPWWIAALMVPWANLHGGFAVGLGLVGLYLAGSWLPVPEAPPPAERWRLARVLGAGFLLACVNPRGPALLLFPLRFVSEDRTIISEWVPTSGALSPVFIPLVLLLVGALALTRRRPQAACVLVTLALVMLSLKAVRHIQFLGFLFTFLLAEQLASATAAVDAALDRWRGLAPLPEPTLGEPPAGDAAPSTREPLTAWLVPGLVLLAVGAFSLSPLAGRLFPRADSAAAPVAAVEALEQADPGGRTFHEYGWGGYLIWRWAPHRGVFVDGREDMYTVGWILREFDPLRSAEPGWRERLDERWKITSVLLRPGAPLLAVLREEPGWRQVYADEEAVVMVRSGVGPRR